ncbi:MAG: ion channel [Bacteriovoracaceae bacterium]
MKNKKTRILILMSLYFANIVLFAFFYSKIPNGFYHSYVAHDQTYKEKLKEFISSNVICEFIAQEVIDKVKLENDGEDCLIIFEDELRKEYPILKNYRRIRIGNPFFRKGKLSFPATVDTDMKVKGQLLNFVSYDGLVLTNYINEFIQFSTVNSVPAFAIFNLKEYAEAQLNEQESYQAYVSPYKNAKLFNLLRSLINYWQRGTVENEVLFERMLYFSFVTASSIGYGDIVPVSTVARWLIVLESIISFILVGLLVHAITSQGIKLNVLKENDERTKNP